MILFYLLVGIIPLSQHHIGGRFVGELTVFKYVGAACVLNAILRLGAEGLEMHDGEEIPPADEPEAFARAVSALLSDSWLRGNLGRAARKRVEQEYSFQVLQAALEEALTHLPAPGVQPFEMVQAR